MLRQTKKHAPFPALLYVMERCSDTLKSFDKTINNELDGLCLSLQKVKDESDEYHNDYTYAIQLIDEIYKIIKEIDPSIVYEKYRTAVSQINNLIDEVEKRLPNNNHIRLSSSSSSSSSSWSSSSSSEDEL